MLKSQPPVCKDVCDWNLVDVQKSQHNSSSQDQNHFKKQLKQQCDMNIDTDLLLKSCMKRLQRAVQKRKQLMHKFKYNPANDVCPSSKHLQDVYNQQRKFLQDNKYFSMSHKPAAIRFETSIKNPYYQNKTFFYGKGLCNETLLNIILIHESDPGHHYMFSRLKNEPKTMESNESNQALIEGWALYAERYHPNDYKFQIAYLTSVIIRTCRTIIDIQIHQNHWSKEQAKQFLQQYYPIPEQIDYELKRVQDTPGFNTCYIAGEHFFVQLFLNFAYKFSTVAEYHERLMKIIGECIQQNQCTMQSIKNKLQKI